MSIYFVVLVYTNSVIYMGKTCPNKNWKNPKSSKPRQCRGGQSSPDCGSRYYYAYKYNSRGECFLDNRWQCRPRSWDQMSRDHVSSQLDKKKCCGIIGNEPILDSNSHAKIGSKLCGQDMCNGGIQCDALIQNYCDSEYKKKMAHRDYDSDKCECYIASKLLTDQKIKELTGSETISGKKTCYLNSCTNSVKYPNQLLTSTMFDDLDNCPSITICSIDGIDIQGAGDVTIENDCETNNTINDLNVENNNNNNNNGSAEVDAASNETIYVMMAFSIGFALLLILSVCFSVINSDTNKANTSSIAKKANS